MDMRNMARSPLKIKASGPILRPNPNGINVSSDDLDEASWRPNRARDDKASIFGRIRNRMLQISSKEFQAPHKEYFKKQSVYESLDYELTESEVELEERRKYSVVQEKWKSISRWIIMFLIGFLTALIAFGIDTGIKLLSKWKFGVVGQNIQRCVASDTDCLASSFAMWVGFDLLFVGVATTLVAIGSPIAAGSGIPEVKCYLNGIKMPQVVRLKTLVAKTVGVMFSVSGGLFVGKEGPMIHSGAVVAAGISQGKSTSLPFLNSGLFSRFRNDTEKRDFVAAGAAAGVSAAFGAPIGGVLFSLEEGASFWNQSLTWRTFFASMTATFFLNVFQSATNPNDPTDELSNPGLLNFGNFEDIPYNVWEIPVFMLMGTIGGLLGALFNFLNERLTIFRMKYINSTRLRTVEAMFIALLTVSAAFGLMLFDRGCLPLGEKPGGEASSLDSTNDRAVQLFCEENQYSAMASLLFNTAEESIKTLFHTNTPDDVNGGKDFEWSTLLYFSIAYFLISCVTYGIAVPSGLFVPCILTGAAWGRMIGELLTASFPGQLWAKPGKYALLGSAAMLGGVVRMTISLTVIIIEATGNITYGLPIMVTVIFAKWAGDYFNEGLYDIHIELKHVPLLAWDPPTKAKHFLTADDLMSRQVVCLYRVANVGQLYYMLQNVKHHAFPIVEFDNEPSETGLATFHGTILRHQLIMILKLKAYGPRVHETVRAKRLSFQEFMASYPRFPSVESIHVPPEDFDKFIDLSPYMNPSPHTVLQESTLARIFRVFRTMGLRHLIVTNRINQVVGMVTRKDLANVKDHHTRRYLRRNTAEVGLIRYILPEEFNVA